MTRFVNGDMALLKLAVGFRWKKFIPNPRSLENDVKTGDLVNADRSSRQQQNT
jgi:hypothetical protein